MRLLAGSYKTKTKRNLCKQVGVLIPLIREACVVFSTPVPRNHEKLLMIVFP